MSSGLLAVVPRNVFEVPLTGDHLLVYIGVRVEKLNIALPKTLTNVLKCKNPRCITSVEQELEHVFVLTDKESKIYRCLYCESKP